MKDLFLFDTVCCVEERKKKKKLFLRWVIVVIATKLRLRPCVSIDQLIIDIFLRTTFYMCGDILRHGNRSKTHSRSRIQTDGKTGESTAITNDN